MDFKTKLLNYFNIDENLYKELSKPVNELTLPNVNNGSQLAEQLTNYAKQKAQIE